MLNTKPLDKYSDLNAALQVNFLEFLKLKEELVKVGEIRLSLGSGIWSLRDRVNLMCAITT